MEIVTDLICISTGFLFGSISTYIWLVGFNVVEHEAEDIPIKSKLDTLTITSRRMRHMEQRCRKQRRKRQRSRISTKKEEQERLFEAFKEHTSSIKNLDATLTVLNETLKKAEAVEHMCSHSPRTVEKCETDEIFCDIMKGETDRVVSSIKNPGLRVLFPSHTNPLQPEFGGGLKDKSSAMHIYDSDFKAPKCDYNPWTLKTSGNKVIYLGDSVHKQNLTIEKLRGENPPSIHNELRGMFQDCSKGDSSLDIEGAEDVNDLFTKPGGGYASMGDLNKMKKEKEVPSVRPKKESRVTFEEAPAQRPVLSRGDELDIINTFGFLKGQEYYTAVQMAQEQGYSLHPVYVNDLPKTPASEYSKSVLGVKIKDPKFGPPPHSLGLFSEEAVIVTVTDVGGQDVRDRGM
uniref:Uncharacterized protein n=1 Tax=Marseillevirus LCMAC101 TaxID=2506602 RepID=A0A481YSN8_9VIRU|nr:MAG: hypothetical protein LCMAC101_06740 [Marseillevirus LCMAC101]